MRVKTTAKRDAILATAAQVFKEAGFDGASMAEISARIGGSKGTLYAYFKSKAELFFAVMHEEAQKEFQPAFDALSSNDGGLERTLLSFGEKVVSFLCQQSTIQTHRVLFAESGRSDIGRRFYEVGPKVGIECIAAYLDGQMNAGHLKDSDPLLAAQQLCALLECEFALPMMLNVESSIAPSNIEKIVKRAVEAFLAIYAI